MTRRRTTGIDAIASAIDRCNVSSIACVPGYPTTDLAERLISKPGTGVSAEWCINEKVAMEIALGVSACGGRSVVIVKHVGMNILADPLITACTHRIGAGVVVIAGDDPMAVASQNEQDSRYWGLLAEAPVLDPNPENAYDAILAAYRISELVSTPAIVRVTGELLQSECSYTIPQKGIWEPAETHSFDRSIWEYSISGKHQLFHRDAYPLMESLSEASHLNLCTTEVTGAAETETGGAGARACIISSGYASAVVESVLRRNKTETATGRKPKIPHLSLTFVNPLPVNLITDFIGDRRALIVEVTEPVIEYQLQPQSGKILGKRSGHLPYGGLSEADIEFAIENIDNDEIAVEITPETLENRGFSRNICDDCPFVPVYEAVKTIKSNFAGTAGKSLLVAGDMGCSIRTATTGVVDVAYALGGAIGAATGAGLVGRSIAIIGDFGLLHSGLQALIDAESKNRDLLVIVLQNRVSAMTGGQEVLDPTAIIRACCSDVTVINDPARSREVTQLITEKLGCRGVSVIVVRGECVGAGAGAGVVR